MTNKALILSKFKELRDRNEFRDHNWEGLAIIERNGNTVSGGFTVNKKVIFDPVDGMFMYMESFHGRNWSIRTFLSEEKLAEFLAEFAPDFLKSF